MFSRSDSGEPELEDGGRVLFQGRLREREEIKTALKKGKNRIIQISGSPSFGKQRLAYQICEELQEESQGYPDDCILHASTISCNLLKSWDELINDIKESLPCDQSGQHRLETNTQNLLKKISTVYCGNNYLIIALTKLDNFFLSRDIPGIFDKFSQLCSDILRRSKNTFLIVTSQVSLKFNIGFLSRDVLLQRLSVSEATMLLHQACPDVDFENSEKDIAIGCYCSPGLIIDAVNIMRHSDGIIKPENLANLLNSPENALDFFSSFVSPEEDRLKTKLENLIKRLPSSIQNSLHELMILKGSFSSEAIIAVLGCKNENEANTRAILPLKHSSVLEYDKDTLRYTLSPLLRAHLDQIPSVFSSDLARLRFVNFFAEVMVTVDRNLYQTSHKSVKEYFHFDYSNVQQLMQQAMHCNEDIFGAIMKAVSGAEELFIKCFPVDKVKDFYNHLLTAAQTFGKPEEIAILKMFLAQAMTQLKVDDNRQEVTNLFQEAYDIFRNSSVQSYTSYHHMILLGFMGRFVIRQGKYQKGLGFIEKALKMKVKDDNKARVHRRRIEFLVQEALGEIFRENYEKAEETLNLAHDIAQKEAPFHEAVALISNTFGLICERSGRDENRALQWYKTSLAERRKYQKIVPEMLVAPLINIASQYLRRGNHEYAKKLVEEALEIRKRCGQKDFYTGLCIRQLAEIHLVRGNINLAMNLCDDALRITEECTPKHFFLDDIRILKSHCHLVVKDTVSATSIFNMILASKERYYKDTDRGHQMMTVLLHSLTIKVDDDWDNGYNELQEELRRLRDRALACDDFDKYHSMQSKINECSRLFTSRRLDHDEVHREKCRNFVIDNCRICKLIYID